jgi:hypothetical protein
MPGLLRGMARTAVVAGTATAVSNRVSRRQAQKWSSQGAYDQPAYQEPPPQYAAAPEPAPQQDMVQQLKDLAELKDQGILTEEEFAAQKARILGSSPGGRLVTIGRGGGGCPGFPAATSTWRMRGSQPFFGGDPPAASPEQGENAVPHRAPLRAPWPHP